jgi:hypothetical protein
MPPMNIYAYTLPQVPERNGWIKIGQTEKEVEKRIRDQLSQAHLQPKIVLTVSALAGKRSLSDKEIHRYLEEKGFQREGKSEWFYCTPEDVKHALDFLKQKYINEDKRKDLSEKFYEELRNWYFWATEEQYQGVIKREHDPDHALRIIVRLLLIFFLKEKGLVPHELFDDNWINENLIEGEEHSYYNVILYNLFFYSLNTPQNKRGELENRNQISHYNKVKEQLHKRIPFLNGGFFNEHPGDDFALNNDYFFSATRTKPIQALDGRFPVMGIVRILSQYKYTLDETDNKEFIDSEFIGKMFECLLACIEADSKESRRKVTGSYYTPREIVDYMVNEALDAYLESEEQSRNRKIAQNETAQSYDCGSDHGSENLLLCCAILDPACGSGAFPCGVMNAIMKRIDPSKTLSPSERYVKKLEVLRNVVYGVDIQPMAVQITVLRLFLSILQEIRPTDDVRDNFGIKPLPNLDYKFAVANALIGIDGNGEFFHEHLKEFNQIQILKSDYFSEDNVSVKERLKHRIENIEQEIVARFQNDVGKFQKQIDDLEKVIADTSNEALLDGLQKRLINIKNRLKKMISSEAVVALCQWNHSDTFPSPYFDSRWMFGIEKFDIVIGNPPYINIENLSAAMKKQLFDNYKTCKGRTDIYIAFIEKALSMLSKNGLLAFIIPYSFRTQKYGTLARKNLINIALFINFFLSKCRFRS